MAKKAATSKSTKKKTTKAPASRKSSAAKTTKKSTSKKVTSKKAPAKKAAAAKSPASKKSAATKKPATKKPAAKKPAPKKASEKVADKKAPLKKTTKKAAERKPTSRKPSRKPSNKAGTKAPASVESAPVEATPAPAAKSPKKSSTGKSGSSKPLSAKAAAKERWKGSYTSDITDSISAATRLAAAAGLRPLHERQTTAAATEEYKKLTKTPFKKRDLDRYKAILLDKRRQVTGDVTDMETEALVGRGSGSLSKLPQHMADAGSDTYDQTLNLDLASSQRKLLKEIDDALARIENKTYGVCELLGKPIRKERLDNTPWARYSIEAARRVEMGF